jgi:dTDP-4-amino-4,6-dideoxygalactose transaminase
LSAKVPFFSFTKAPNSLRQEWLSAIEGVIDRGIFIRGEEVARFEANWGAAVGTRYAIGTSNGQDALILALRALGITNGHRVVVPAHSFIATHNAVLALGAEVVSVDVNEFGLINEKLLKHISGSIHAIIPVHMHGMMCNMPIIMEWAKVNSVAVIEDCSQSHLAEIGGVKAGNWGDIGVFSLYPTKNLGAIGDAGVIVTNDEELGISIFSLANYGSSKHNKYEHLSFGLNNRLDEIQAAVLNVNLGYLPEWNNRRQQIVDLYSAGIKNPKVSILQPKSTSNVSHHFCILVENRDAIRIKLKSKNIDTEIHYPFVASNEVESYLGKPMGNYPLASEIAAKSLSLPISPWHSDQEIIDVIYAINNIL